jgi:kynurenine 3-monooxygenase
VAPQCINSLDRAILNEMLLSRALATPNIRVHFKHKVQAIDFEKKIITLADQEGGHDVYAAFDLCVGADGSYSVVRRQLQRVVRWVPA